MVSRKLKTAAVTLGCLLLAAAAVGQAKETARLELSSFQEGESRDFPLGAGILRVERRGAAVEVSHVRAGSELPLPLLGCVIAESHCSIRLEEHEGRTRVRLLRKGDAQEELVLEDRAGRLALVAGMVATSRIGIGRRLHVLEEPGRAQTAYGVQATASSEALLRCPEGDSWMLLPAEEAEGAYYSCQRHARQLEIAGGAKTSPRQR